MSNDILRNVLMVLAKDSTPRDQQWSHGAWAQAQVWHDNELTAALTARLDLPSDLLEEAGKRNEMPIRIAYLSRPDHDPAVVSELLMAERRAGVVAGFYRTCKESKMFLHIIEKHLREKPTVVLVEAVLEADVVPTSDLAILTLQTALTRWDSLTDSQHQAASRFIEALSADDSAMAKMLDMMDSLTLSGELRHRVVALLVRKGNITKRLVESILKEYITTPVNDLAAAIAGSGKNLKPGSEPYAVRQLIRSISYTLNELRGILQTETYEQACAIIRNANLGAFSPLESSDTKPLLSREQKLEIINNANSNSTAAVSKLLNEEPDILKDQLLLGALLDNTALVQLMDTELPSELSYEEVVKAALECSGGRHAGRIYAMRPDDVFEQDKLASLSGESKPWVVIAMELSKRHGLNSTKDHWRSYSLESACASFVDVCPDPEAIAELPWEFVGYMVEHDYWVERQAKVADAVAVQMERHLGGKRAHWEALSALSQDFNGSIRELVSISTKI